MNQGIGLRFGPGVSDALQDCEAKQPRTNKQQQHACEKLDPADDVGHPQGRTSKEFLSFAS